PGSSVQNLVNFATEVGGSCLGATCVPICPLRRGWEQGVAWPSPGDRGTLMVQRPPGAGPGDPRLAHPYWPNGPRFVDALLALMPFRDGLGNIPRWACKHPHQYFLAPANGHRGHFFECPP